MNINDETKMIIDTENKYLFDENDIIVLLKENKDLDILAKYSNKNYSIGGNFTFSDSTDYKIIKNYSIINEKLQKDLKKSHSFAFSLIDKLNLNPLAEKGVLLTLSFDEIINM